jgi:hypothetical protein
MDEYTPETESSGALTPPPRNPPTALATSAPLPSRPSAGRFRLRPQGLRGLLESALDRLDALADRIAGAAGLR